LLALWISSGAMNKFHNADSLIQTLISQWEWTPFYWGQNRFGMLVPLLAKPISNPIHNVLFQSFLATFAGLLSFQLIVLWAGGDEVDTIPTQWWVPIALFVIFFGDRTWFEYFSHILPYGVSMAITVGAMLLLRQVRVERLDVPRLAIAFLLSCIGHWVNAAVGYLLAPVLVFSAVPEWWSWRNDRNKTELLARLWKQARNSSGLIQGLVLLLSGAFGNLISKGGDNLYDYYAFLPLVRWPQAWSELIINFCSASLQTTPLQKTLSFTIVIVLACGILHTIIARRIGIPRSALVLMLAGIGNILLVSTLRWVDLNNYNFRYALPGVVFVLCGIGITAGTALKHCVINKHAFFTRAPAIFVLLSLAAVLGLPSIHKSVRTIRNIISVHDNAIKEAHCSHLLGTYWDVWPAVLAREQALFEGRETERLWGISDRAGQVKALWLPSSWNDKVICAVGSGPDRSRLWNEFSIPQMPVSRIVGDMTVYSAQ